MPKEKSLTRNTVLKFTFPPDEALRRGAFVKIPKDLEKPGRTTRKAIK